jgi:hypothetical protein
MTNKPSLWGTKDAFIPTTKIEEHIIVASPFISKGAIAFKGSTEITLGNVDKKAIIYYRLGYKGGFKKYETPFIIDTFINLSVYAQIGETKSKTITTDFYKIDPTVKIDLQSEYANQYNAGGDHALIDGIVGAEDFRTGTWQGYFDTDLVAVVDLGKEKSIESIQVNFLEDQRSWIFLPTEIEYLISSDGRNFKSISKVKVNATEVNEQVKIKEDRAVLNGKYTRYIKIIAKKLGMLPKWHLGYKHNGRSWLFVDEIQIK